MPKNEWHWEMSDDELWIAFRDAKSKKEIVRIIADRNVTAQATVIAKLREIAAERGYDAPDFGCSVSGRFSDEEISTIREMSASGAGVVKIAADLGRSTVSVSKWIDRNWGHAACDSARAAAEVATPSQAFAPAEPAKLRVPQAVIDALKARLVTISRSISSMSSDQESIRAFLARCEA